MLNLFLVLFVLVVWSAIYGLYFREPLTRWFGNRFGRDKPPPPADANADPGALFTREKTGEPKETE